jgi:hypothetical protein
LRELPQDTHRDLCFRVRGSIGASKEKGMDHDQR